MPKCTEQALEYGCAVAQEFSHDVDVAPVFNTVAASSSASPMPEDNTDRAIKVAEFQRLQALTHQFTVDCCANDDGSNALVDKFYSASNSMLDADLSGQHCWINPPFNDLDRFINHYKSCKLQALDTTSACILLPKLLHAKELCKGMQLIAEYTPGTQLFTAHRFNEWVSSDKNI